MIHIRKSIPADSPALTAIWRASVIVTHDFLSPSDFREIEILVGEHYLPHTEVLVIEDDGMPVGFMGLTGANIDSLFISPDQRGKGIGKHMIAHARTLGTLTVDVNEQNVQGAGFYRHMGFVETGRSETDDQGRPYPLLHLRLEA